MVSFVSRRRKSFALLFGSGVGLMLVLKAVGLEDDLAMSAIVLPVLVLFLWNRSSERDRFHGMSASTLTFSAFASLYGFTQYKTGTAFEVMHLIGLIGTCTCLLWIMTLLLALWGVPKDRTRTNDID